MSAVPWDPRPYQLEAIEFGLSRAGAGLLLDPGLGKTSSYLAIISILLERKDIRKVLVVAPLRVAQTVWPMEAKKWTDFCHLTVCDLTEKTDQQREELLRRNYQIYVINPESAYKVLNPNKITGMKVGQLDNPWGFDMFIADESTRYADPSTQRFKLLKPFLRFMKHRGVATGTPTPNGLQQLFGQAYILDDGRALGEYITHFRQMYMHPHPYIPYSYEMNHGAADKIYERIGHLFLRMKAQDHLDMPELIHNRIMVKLPPSKMEQYRVFERDFLITVQDVTVPAFNRASKGVKCRQLANGFIYSQADVQQRTALAFHDEKLDALGQLLEEMQGRPLLLMYEFIQDGLRIMERFPQAINITGSKDIVSVVNDFNAGRIPLLIGHPRSAGHGLNLQQACSDICWFGVIWDLELWLQAIARVWRQGQPSSFVKNHIILAADTTDEPVLEGLTAKEANQNSVDQALSLYATRRLG